MMTAVKEETEGKKNCLCELLGIRYPIIQAPMNWVSGAALAAAVSNAGGLGTLGPNAGAKTVTTDVALTGERLRDQIKKMKRLTKNPFAVNVAIGTGELRQYAQRWVEVILEEGIPAAIVSAGSPTEYTKTLKNAGIKVLHAVSTATHAKKAEQAGVDAVICEGYEAGGHKGFTELTTFVLIPMVAHAVKVPVVAGGGIADAKGVLAALALGAHGIYMGTRFMATRESDSHDHIKEAVVKAEDVCTISVPKGMLSRDLKNQFTQKYLGMKEAGASPKELNDFLNEFSQYRSQVLGDVEGSEVACGQVAGLIMSVASAAEVIQGIASGLPSLVEELKRKIAPFKMGD
jgi:NAD(P)H-dependent flavin oxidoreductase YrpB (nitropropane dioxygenase family)